MTALAPSPAHAAMNDVAIVPPDLRACFPHARPIEVSMRSAAGHETLCDPTFFAGCGYMTPEEAALIYAIAKSSPPGWWLEIGTHTGWSLAHVIAAGRDAIGLDPEYAQVSHNATRSPDVFLKRASENLQRVREAVAGAGAFTLMGITSGEFFADPSLKPGGQNPVGVIIDGDHGDPHPVNDALDTVKHLRPRIVVLHDAMIHAVQRAAFALQTMGYHTRTYRTAQLLVVAWRDDAWSPPAHTPDAKFDWRAWMQTRHLPYVPWDWPTSETYDGWSRFVNRVKLRLRTGKFRSVPR